VHVIMHTIRVLTVLVFKCGVLFEMVWCVRYMFLLGIVGVCGGVYVGGGGG